ncbi:MAG: 7-cyano-7-deazaguanine synthase QueC [Pirellulaceae bacterium]|nr:7-cyano-7-deazaguanine synthase QueC [Pirellulaceae bacterium]
MGDKGKKGVVLLSGGLDSTTTLALALEAGFTPYGLTFRYGQRHDSELKAAEKIAQQYTLGGHIVVDIDLGTFGGSALTSEEYAIPKGVKGDSPGIKIPVTYVPARNTIFLSFALAYAETLGASDIFIGVNALDYSGYPDCRPEYIEAFSTMANLATKAGVEGNPITIHTPLIHKTKAEIIEEGVRLGVDYSQTISCYDASKSGQACGECEACLLRKKGFAESGQNDPTNYV